MSSDFDAFVKQARQEASSLSKFDAEKRRDWWIEHLKHLYKTIISHLKSYKEVEIQETEIELNENLLGVYKAQRLTLTIGLRQVIFTPVGTMIIGCGGRVDVSGPGATARLLLVDKKAISASSLVRIHVSRGQSAPPPPPELPLNKTDWAWKILSAPPEMTFKDLTQESLQNIIMSAANG